MLWFFRREQETTSVEVRFDEETGDFVLTLTPDGKPAQVERYASYEGFEARVAALEQQLEGEAWHQQSSPIVLPTGWRTSPPAVRH